MTSFESDSFPRVSNDNRSQRFGFSRPLALLGLIASVMVITGCGAAHRAFHHCDSRGGHSNSCDQITSSSMPSYCHRAATPHQYPVETSPSDRELMGGSGLATGESYLSESPVEVAPVPPQWSQPVIPSTDQPAIQAEPDVMELEESQISDPIEI